MQIVKFAFEDDNPSQYSIGEMIEKYRLESDFKLNTEGEQRMFQWLYIKKELWAGTELDKMSLSTFSNPVKLFGGDYYVKEGYCKIVEHFAEKLEGKIKLEHVVEKIDYSQNEISVKTNKGTFLCDRVVMTVPVGVLRAQTIEFSPPLPQSKLAAINAIGMGVLNKIALLFDTLFWPEGISAINYVSDKRAEFPYFLNLYQVHKKPVLVCFVSGSYAIELEKLSDEEIISQVMSKLLLMFPQAPKTPTNYLISRWHQDPYFFGAYSYLAVNSTGEECAVIAEPVNNKLFFAGEHALQGNRSTTSGAFTSGQDAAEKIIHLKK